MKRQIQEFELADIAAEIQPLGCVMAGDSPRPWERGKKKKDANTETEANS